MKYIILRETKELFDKIWCQYSVHRVEKNNVVTERITQHRHSLDIAKKDLKDIILHGERKKNNVR